MRYTVSFPKRISISPGIKDILNNVSAREPGMRVITLKQHMEFLMNAFALFRESDVEMNPSFK
jgi:hypothetical protein